MKAIKILPGLAFLTLVAIQASGRELPKWEPRLYLTGSAGVWSPGGVDKDRYLASLGGSLGVLYWFNWNTQVLLSGTYASLNTERYYWLPSYLAGSPPDVWDVKGSLWSTSLELRRLFPTDNKNYLYLAIGGDIFHFGQVEGNYEIYGTTTTKGVISQKRDPSEAVGLHFAPGLFFLFHRKVPMDVTVRLHTLYDGEDAVLWIEPTFTVGYRLF